jgi:ParB-like chromosome segregation protein Spo0J
MTERMKLAELMAKVTPGEPHDWPTEFEWLRKEAGGGPIRALIASILRVGIQRPVLIGSDGRLWDGHHRVYAAWALGLTEIAVEYAREGMRV